MIPRVSLAKAGAIVLALGLFSASLSHKGAPVIAGGALSELVSGNQRFMTGRTLHARQSRERRMEVAKGQHPFAVIVGCADSRVPPELVFDQGLGDLFVVRVAGNVVDDGALASVEYAVEHLGASLIVVLGHERCGAVHAALSGGELAGHLGALAAAISPAVEAAKSRPSDDPLETAVGLNVERVVRQLAHSEPILAERVYAGELEVLGARYDLDSGEVEFYSRAAGVR